MLLQLVLFLSIAHITQGALLHHDTHHFKQHIRSCHRSQLRIGIIRWRHLHDISPDQVNFLEPSNDSSQLPCTPPSSLRGSGSRCERGIKSVNIDRQVHGISGADPVDNLLDDAIHADGVNFPSLDDLEAYVAVIFVVAGAAEGRANSGMDVGVVLEKTLLGCVVLFSLLISAKNQAIT